MTDPVPRQPDETVHDEHPTEPAEGARHPGNQPPTNQREHPSDPAEGPRDDDDDHGDNRG